MKYSKFPYTILGLLLVTVCLAGVILFQGTQLNASDTIDAKAQLSALANKYKEAQLEQSDAPVVVIDTVQQEPETVPKVKQPQRKVQPSTADVTKSQNYVAQADLVIMPEVPKPEEPVYECTASSFELDRYDFEVETPQISYQVDPGEAFETTIYIKNTGTSNWCGEAVSENAGKLRLGTALPQDRVSQILTGKQTRIQLDAPEGLILPGETAAFTIKGQAPTEPGVYREYFQPVVEQIGWFGDVTINLDLFVTGYFDEDLEKSSYLKMSGNTNEFELDDKLYINIDLATQTEYVYKGKKLIHSYLVSSGAYATPTPVGLYEVHNKQELRIGGAAPHYRMPFWIGLKRPGGRFRGYGIHALPYLGNDKNASNFWKEAIDHLGVRVSHGCIRRSDSDAEWLWHLVDPDNTRIEVFASFNQADFEQKLAFGEI